MATVDIAVTTTREQAETGKLSVKQHPHSAPGTYRHHTCETIKFNQNNRKTDGLSSLGKVVTTTREQAGSGETGRFTETSVWHEKTQE